MGYRTYVSTDDQVMEWQPTHDLLQLQFMSNAWKMMVACILLNRTKRIQVDHVHPQLFKTYPSAYDMSGADQETLAEILRPLGLSNRRAASLISFSHDFFCRRSSASGYDLLLELERMKGIGDYALDAYAIFILGHINIRPLDKELIEYVRWLGADVRKHKIKRYAILHGHVRSKYDGEWHHVRARQLLRLYNLDPEECFLIETDDQWRAWLRANDETKFKILSTRYEGDYHRVHDQLMAERAQEDLRRIHDQFIRQTMSADDAVFKEG